MKQAILALLMDGKWHNTRDIRKCVTGRNTRVAEALLMLSMEGIIQVRVIGRNKEFRLKD
jgi:hypothetical protein